MYQFADQALYAPAQLCPDSPDRRACTPAHYTPVPHTTLDALLPTLRGSEAKVLLYIQRRTLGFGKTADPISLAQFQRGIVTRDGRHLDGGCGVRDRSTLIAALRVLADRGIITVEHRKEAHGGDLATVYRLVPAAHDLPEGGGVGFAHGRGVGFAHPQEIELQEKEGNDFDLSKACPLDDDSPTDPETTPATQTPSNDPLPTTLPPPSAVPAKAAPPPADPVRAHLTPYVTDIARELRDKAKLTASVTRVYRVWQLSGLPVEAFVARIQTARAITQERSAAIRDRAPDGQARKFGYFCAVLADQCGAKSHAAELVLPASVPPVAPVDAPLPSPNGEAADTVLPARAMPPLPPPAVRDRERAIFWEQVRAETGIGDLRAFAREFNRPPPAPGDAAATVAWVRGERRRQR